MSNRGQELPVDEDLRNLIEKLADEIITAEDQQRLEARLRDEQSARDFYLEFMDLQGLLRWLARGDGVSADANGQPVTVDAAIGAQSASQTAPKSTVLGFLGSAMNVAAHFISSPKVLALTILGCLTTYFVGLIISVAISRAFFADRQSQERAELPSTGGARILAESECRWQDQASKANLGGRLRAAMSCLSEGIVDLEFDGGARVRIEGPAEFAPESGQRMQLARGRLLAYVPRQARGFIIRTPMAELVDLGTEFGVEVDTAGKTNVHVLQGVVEVRPSAKAEKSEFSSQKVTAGQAVRVFADGGSRGIESVEFFPGKFIRTSPRDSATRFGKASKLNGGAQLPVNFVEYGTEVQGFQDFFISRDFTPGWIEVVNDRECPAGMTRNFSLPGDGTLHIEPSHYDGDPNKLLYRRDDYAGNRQTVLAMIKVLEPLGVNSDGWRGGVSICCNPATADGIGLVLRQAQLEGQTSCLQAHVFYDRRDWGPPRRYPTLSVGSYNWLRLTYDGQIASYKVWAADGVTPEPDGFDCSWSVVAAPGIAGLVGNSLAGVGRFQVDYVLIRAAGLPAIKAGIEPK